MSLNITFDGFAYLGDGTLSNENVQYQAYFCKIGSGSSTSQWNDVRVVESSGYWNFNLGDGDFLGQDGNTISGDVVVVAFWRGGDRMGTDCSVLGEWGAVQIVLDGSSTYTMPTQVDENILPNLIWSFPTDGEAGITYSSYHNSNDLHIWDWMGTSMAHIHIYDTEPIYFVNYVRFTSYFWGDGDSDEDLPLVAGGSHSWSIAGDYEVKIVIEDHCGGTVTGTENIRIKYPPPSPNIDCNEDNGSNHVEIPDTVVTFDYNGTNNYDVITSIDWTIVDDTDTTSPGHAVSDIVSHDNGEGTSWYGHTASSGAFTDPGTHNVAIVVSWNDGFDDHIINYNENFVQDYFSGPDVDFDQVPDPVAVTSGVIFNNTTSDPENRVGTAGAGEEYDWEWDDEGNVDNIYNVPYSYVYGNTPGSDDVTIELCGHWNDGWDDYVECELKNVAIKTTVAIVQNDCYYELTVFGTSLDGSVSGYHWEIERSTTSGIAGPYELIWESPTGMDQKEKTIAFTEQNYFKVIGYVHGNGDTTDYEVIYVDTVCDDECALIIWNGTGEHDSGGDWNHSGHGFEADYAKYEGTNGLDATGFTNNKKIHFQDSNENNVDQYDVLSMQINLKEWSNGGNIKLYFEDGNEVNIINYLQTYNLDQWQRILIPLEDFGLTAPINLKKLTMESVGELGMYLDNVEFTIGSIVRGVIDVGKPDMEADETQTPTMRAGGITDRPAMRAYSPPINLG